RCSYRMGPCLMIPEGRKSTTAVVGSWLNPMSHRAIESSHWGPIALNDPSKGLLARLWVARLTGDNRNEVAVSTQGVAPVTLFVRGQEIKQLSLAFDQNGQPYVSFVEEDDTAWLWWYDTIAATMVFTQLAAGVRTPRITLDDARQSQN